MISRPQTPREQAEAHLLDRKLGLYSALVHADVELTDTERELVFYLAQDHQIQAYLEAMRDRQHPQES